MTPRLKLQDDRSKRAIRKGLQELRQLGWIKERAKSICYARVGLQANSFGKKRLAVITLRDGTKIAMLALRMSSDPRWFSYQADIKKNDRVRTTIKVMRQNENPLVWNHHTLYGIPLLDFWGRGGYSETEIRKLEKLFRE